MPAEKSSLPRCLPALALQVGEERAGSVARMTRQREFGLIRTGGQLDIFFHRSDLDDGRWWDEIREGTEVCFTVDRESKGWQARHVRGAKPTTLQLD